ncbi:copper amine oxidase N-terminal domain-containing protein [Paenibacillus ginsengarvi]|uniref:Copper amine oxidase N-terminal domain-containing protein n=1 Tax=Paenibacillus ginsengarvi TaxID=400777 RepID=A0A3B0CJJ9_9BACL|nr:copper amine oxidase N-terminal domain-containing protein [Paenibacillus ginsengarvi]RKN84439.1 copper amine oxidase N-terminal domain-containing protein [Paenibacillus ginsengarvi]
MIKRVVVLLLSLGLLLAGPGFGIIPALAQPNDSGGAGIASLPDTKPDKHYMVLTAASFASNMGNWTKPADKRGSPLADIMLGGTDGKDHGSTPAKAKYGIPADGVYKMMVHTRDFAASPGTRPFKLKLDGSDPAAYGAHGFDGWRWETSGPQPMIRGEFDLEAIDFRGNYARFDMIVITDDLSFSIVDSPTTLQWLASQYSYVPGTVVNGQPDPNRPPVDIAVRLNGQYVTLNAQPVLAQSTVMVPFGELFASMGAAITVDAATYQVTAMKNGMRFQVRPGQDSALVNGRSVLLETPAVSSGGEAFVPLSFVKQYFGAHTFWDEGGRTAVIVALIPSDAYLFRPDSFDDLGTWTAESGVEGAFERSVLRGIVPAAPGATPDMADPSSTRPAVASFEAVQAGTYKVWVRSRDFATNQPGTRFFNVGLNGQMLPQRFGVHGQDGFKWAEAGVVQLQPGTHTLELYDTSGFYARCDAVLLTADLQATPPEDYTQLLRLAAPLGPEPESFPAWATTQNEPIHSVTLENAATRVVFYKVPTASGQVVQSEVYARYEGDWVKTKNRSEELGYLVLSADSSSTVSTSQDMYAYKSKFTMANGNVKNYAGTDLYKAGLFHWFIPTDYEMTPSGGIRLLFNEPLADFSSLWEMDGDNPAPKVTVQATFHQAGTYSIGAWEGRGFADEQYEFALAPYRVLGKRIAPEAGLMTEQHLFTPMGTLTLNASNAYLPGQPVTKGVVAEPSWIPQRWVYGNNGKFGISMRGTGYNPKGSIFAPVLGAADAKFAAGQSYTMQYRVISRVGDWYDSYKFVTQNLFGVHDYRQNVYGTLNDAVFNARKLMMDDELGGWDVHDKAHYNMEGKNATSSANPMQALQEYLLTEDKDILTRRAIPTLANFLTRKELHFNRTPEWGGVDYWQSNDLPKSIGSPISGYNLNVVGGLYEMTRGAVPYLYQYGLDKGKATVTNSYGSIPTFSNNLSLYKYTGDSQYLDKARQQARQYVTDAVHKPQTEPVGWSTFIYISYYPNVASLIDLYEVTHDPADLAAAEEAARWLATMLWVPGIDGPKLNGPVTVNDMTQIRANFHYGNEASDKFWWHGDEQERLGRPPGDPGDLSSNYLLEQQMGQVPGWIPSRVGLGLEQASTFGRSSNIIMSSWAGDMLKLADYTGDPYFADVARNAIVGRFTNYPGYYQNAFMTFQQKPEYPLQGPDYTGIYWHHLPPFLSMLEDFLVNLTQLWSNDYIQFPSLRQQGYAYFNSNQYGHAPGRFFGEQEMWLWLDEHIVETDNVQIDWLAARKDGVLGIALMNEGDASVTTSVYLGSKVPGGSEFNGTAELYAPDGSMTGVSVTGGEFEATIPAKSMKGAVLRIPGVRKPAFAQMTYALDGQPQLGQTVSEHTYGKAMVLQMSPESYYAYVYVTDKPDHTQSASLIYRIGEGAEQTETTNVYPYEFIIEVPDATKSFSYRLEATSSTGVIRNIAGGTIAPRQSGGGGASP